jgi:hypothetical protein
MLQNNELSICLYGLLSHLAPVVSVVVRHEEVLVDGVDVVLFDVVVFLVVVVEIKL